MIIIEGLKLMVVGMTTVMLFLSFMILLIGLAARLTRDVTARELQAIEAEKQRLKREREMAKQAATPDDDIDIVVITAAIAAFEAERAAA